MVRPVVVIDRRSAQGGASANAVVGRWEGFACLDFHDWFPVGA